MTILCQGLDFEELLYLWFCHNRSQNDDYLFFHRQARWDYESILLLSLGLIDQKLLAFLMDPEGFLSSKALG